VRQSTLIPIFISVFMLGMTGCTPKTSEVASESSTEETTTTTTTSSTTTTTTVPPITYNEKKIAVGWDKTFAVLSSGTASSCGANVEAINGSNGQLGLGLTGVNNFNTPQTLNDSGTSYLAVVSGEINTCGLTSAQRVKCWGDNVGDGSGGVKNLPTFTSDTSTYDDIASGSYHNCGVTTAGVLKCWGDGWEGKLGNGDGTGAGQASPVIAMSGTSFKRVAAGRNHTCAITSAGAVQCWGSNNAGQTGSGNLTTPQLAAVTVDSGTSYSEIAAGEDSSCGITTAGVLKCWGNNTNGVLGDGSSTTRSSPVVIDSGVTYSKITIGGTWIMHSCGITTAGVLKCWGNNSAGQVGRGDLVTPVLSPVVVDTGVTYREVSATGKSTCAITTGGTLKCWGNNSVGQLCNGNTSLQNAPVTIGTGY